jgi:protein arginine N-methyltransferase 1
MVQPLTPTPMRIDYHRTLIADHVRNTAFRDALAQLIVPGVTTVADIGAGTGLIGLMAERLGAREVTLYEAAGVAGVAAEVLKRNRARRCTLMPCHSTEMRHPPRVDLVVSETLGNYPFEEDIIDTMADARARHLAPSGRIVPSALTQLVAPIVSDRMHAELSVWDAAGDRLGLALDLSPARTMSFNNVYVRSFVPSDLLDGSTAAAAKVWDEIDFADRNRTTRQGEARWRLARPAKVYGFATWWRATLAPGIVLSTAPDAPRTHWEQLYFPLERPLSIGAGESVGVALRSRSSRKGGTHLAWTATHADRNGRQRTRIAHDLDKGWLP